MYFYKNLLRDNSIHFYSSCISRVFFNNIDTNQGEIILNRSNSVFLFSLLMLFFEERSTAIIAFNRCIIVKV